MEPHETTEPRPVRRRWRPDRRAVGRAVRLLLFVAVVAVAADAGMRVRRWTYTNTQSLRHEYDIRHNLYYGGRAIDDGVLNLYGNIRRERPDGRYGLDYVPLRLIAMRQWAAWVRARHGPYVMWQHDYAFTRPLLLFNTALEAASAVAIFLLVRLWVRRADAADRAPPAMLDAASPRPANAQDPWLGAGAGLAAALIAWFSPAAHVSAHGWPSWDIWVIPFYLYAVLLACVNRWFVAGAVLGVGTMFKGQQLMMVPLFLLWPLFMGRAGAALRWASGYVFAGAVIVAPWLLRVEETRRVDWAAIVWVGGAIAACAGALFAATRVRRTSVRAVIGLAGAAWLAWPLLTARAAGLSPGTASIVLALLAMGALALFLGALALRPRRHGYLAAGVVGGALALCPFLFRGDLTWWDLAFRYGSEKFPSLQAYAANTLPSLLAVRFGWRGLDETVATLPAGALWAWPAEAVRLELRAVLVGLFVLGVVLSAVGMARHTLRRDRHFLVAMTAPWLVAFAVMPQMHSRYLLFAATIGAVTAGVGVGMALLNVVLIVLAWAMTVHLMVANRRRSGPLLEGYVPEGWGMPVLRAIEGAYPDAAYAVLLIAAVFVYVAVVPSAQGRGRWGWSLAPLVAAVRRFRVRRGREDCAAGEAALETGVADAPPRTA